MHTGFVVKRFNHAMHQMSDDNQINPAVKKKTKINIDNVKFRRNTSKSIDENL